MEPQNDPKIERQQEETNGEHEWMPPAPPVEIVSVPETGRRWTSPAIALSAIFGDLMVALVISAIVILFLYQPVRVEGTSMLPQLEDQDRLFINKFAYRFEQIQRGDVVVFLYPGDHTKSYIKRVIALPGDTLRIDRGQVYVNDKALKEPYVPLKYEDDRSASEMTIPQGEYFMMGAHRSISSDSRDFGPVARSLIYGKASFVYWPVDQAGVVR
jgi:signal peptidase I